MDLHNQFIEFALAPRTRDDFSSFGSKQPGSRTADPGTSAGDDSDFSGQPSHDQFS
jgi:hypothetical protein